VSSTEFRRRLDGALAKERAKLERFEEDSSLDSSHEAGYVTEEVRRNTEMLGSSQLYTTQMNLIKGEGEAIVSLATVNDIQVAVDESAGPAQM